MSRTVKASGLAWASGSQVASQRLALVISEARNILRRWIRARRSGKGDTRAALPSSKWITSGRCGSGSARPIGRGVKVEGGAAEQAHAVGLFEVRAGVSRGRQKN